MRHLLCAAIAGGTMLLLGGCTSTSPEPTPTTSRPTSTPSTTSATSTRPPVTTTTTVSRTPTKTTEVAKPLYSCEPAAPAKFEHPTNPHIITNKDCPDLNAERSRAQLEYADQLEREAREAEKSRATMTDANGETYEEYCRRTGQPLESCAAG